MVVSDSQTQPSQYSPANTPIKRKHIRFDDESPPRRLSKKQKFVTGTETLTLISETKQNDKQEKHKRKDKEKEIENDDVYGSRRWVVSSRDSSNFKDKVVIVSYNILGVENSLKHPDLYSNIPPKFLEWKQRKKRIREEIKSYHPSILCFQEVDRFDDLENLLQKDGFKGVHKGRTGEACDGCAIFWIDEVFTLMHQEYIKFESFGLRNNVAQFCILKINQCQSHSDVDIPVPQSPSTRSLVVGNIHVLYNPKRGDIKLGQVRLFLEKARKLSHEWGNIPIVLAGDLNSMPQSAIYQFLSSSELDIRLYDRRKISGQVGSSSHYRSYHYYGENTTRYFRSTPKPFMYSWSNEEVSLATGCEGVTHLKHRLNLCSAYAAIPGSSDTRDNLGEPLATSFHSKFMGTVDYIWHTEELIPIRVLETLPIGILRRTGGLPSKEWGSDHLALVCELAFVDENYRRASGF